MDLLTLSYQGRLYSNWKQDDLSKNGVPDSVIQEAISENQWNEVRVKRDHLISSVDWTQMSDAPIPTDKKTEFAAYRQALRDIPQTYSNPEDVVWPVKPTL
ncbi:TPA: phage tail assembly chaperone [Vibrio parahaemolyticus]|nr:hypothetical protein [Vibrio parahaemolyticus]HCE2195109.1 phage tail assembly chaperone [Vibrio parahaemolyticus]HCG6674082.1 phage tail assembly chaperone [Vibrio parahaemolyticus]HCG7224876.1 phage tail assembly chaperone [Vibrio parahaemolyticus]HCG7318954.1 phage tail assembly chaperone [Vibrio parahaemolyticus]